MSQYNTFRTIIAGLAFKIDYLGLKITKPCVFLTKE